MDRPYRAAITAAVAFSALSLYDALHHGLTGRGSVFSDEYGRTWGSITSGVLSAVSFAALATVLVSTRARVDRGNKVRAWIRRLLTVDFAVLALTFAVGAPFFSDPGSSVAARLAPVAGVAFAGMFLLSFTLGVSIARHRELRASAVLLIAVLPIIGLTFALHGLAPMFEHPAYAETVVYLGVALLGRGKPAARTAPRRDAAPVRSTTAKVDRSQASELLERRGR